MPILNNIPSTSYQRIMIFTTFAIALLPFFAARAAFAQNQTRDGCPKDDYACIDVINSSQCIEQLVIEKLAPATKEALAKCVEYEGTATNIPGAAKVRSRVMVLIGTRDKLTYIVNSFVDAQDVILHLSTLQSRNCSNRHVHDGKAHEESEWRIT
jgi:hypothetical protein